MSVTDLHNVWCGIKNQHSEQMLILVTQLSPKKRVFLQLSQDCSCMQKINIVHKPTLTLPPLPRFSVCHLFAGCSLSINLSYFLHRERDFP